MYGFSLIHADNITGRRKRLSGLYFCHDTLLYGIVTVDPLLALFINTYPATHLTLTKDML